ncbi:MAG: methyltransferase domain-containing protein [Gemmatimonadetes bacterium]|nr:class I SAM-dependent methyltransferase [Gemmatimonadota bacterium]NIR80913.1 class I SAM-dependent methyltransferase [Gemmatimonadota bacterium]NIT89731.1 class I SAM-dependent methyltransferase [Gemmatimonadota bacterium]NIU33517.1 class I SAM-dependent methyltransferase [Gemmatimonadota bacterium]NIU37787.1 methyltransferase domain-containing protein [Gemmatimonadota bacterium]
MSAAENDRPLRARIRDYYRTVSRYIDRERLDRTDRVFWSRLVRDSRCRTVLELGCGTGRITRVLADAASLVVGVDLSPEMLERARRRVGDRRGVHLLRADMRTLRLGRAFDRVLAANDPFAHLTSDADRDRAVATAARHLAPGGRFVLEGHWLTPDEMRRAGRPSGLRRVRTPDGDEELRIREVWRCREETRRCRARYEYVRDDGTVESAEFDARLWTTDELVERLERTGLELDGLWGGFDRRPFRPGRAVRILARARRAGAPPERRRSP